MKTEIRTCLLTLVDLTDTEISANEPNIIESLIDNVMDGKLRLLYDRGKVSFQMTPEGKEYVENMGQGSTEETTEI